MTHQRPELPACAAIRTPHGFIFAGKRHGECLTSLCASGYTPRYATQGFMTTHGRFVDRREGRALMNAAGIPSVAEGGYRDDELFSEDLY